jgi:hypothetical protein
VVRLIALGTSMVGVAVARARLVARAEAVCSRREKFLPGLRRRGHRAALLMSPLRVPGASSSSALTHAVSRFSPWWWRDSPRFQTARLVVALAAVQVVATVARVPNVPPTSATNLDTSPASRSRRVRS